MARTVTDIVTELGEAQQQYPELSALNSPSQTAIHRLWKYVVAFCFVSLEKLWDAFRAEIDAKIARAQPGTPEWYADRALEFQVGDTLVVDDEGIHYPAGSTGKRLIVRAAAKEAEDNGLLKLFIKVAKEGSTAGTLAALDEATELVQVRGYFSRIRHAGVRLEVVSRDADRLQVTGEVYYDPLLGSSVRPAVAQAIRNYLAALDFDGLVYVARVQDAIQAVPGVKDVHLTNVAAVVGTEAPKDIERVYETAAGYVVEDAAPYDFATTLTFVPYGQE